MKTMKKCMMYLMVLVMALSLMAPVTAEAATKVKLNKKKVTLTITNKKNPTVTLKVKGTLKKPSWSTSNKKVATVKKGKVTAKKAGKATITCKVNGKRLTCKVTVVDKRKKSGLSDIPEKTPKCEHEWVEHWTSLDADGEYVFNGESVFLCACGKLFSGDAIYNHIGRYDILWGLFSKNLRKLGPHSECAKSENSEQCIRIELEDGTIGEKNIYHIHTDYVDYLYCTKCGEQLRLPEGYE